MIFLPAAGRPGTGSFSIIMPSHDISSWMICWMSILPEGGLSHQMRDICGTGEAVPKHPGVSGWEEELLGWKLTARCRQFQQSDHCWIRKWEYCRGMLRYQEAYDLVRVSRADTFPGQGCSSARWRISPGVVLF